MGKTTILKNNVTRECDFASDNRGNRLIVTLEVGDVLAIRPKTLRKFYRLPLQTIYMLAVQREADRIVAERHARRKNRRRR